MKELELYVHIPFCVHKCHYCDFLSDIAEETVKKKYVSQLLLEIWTAAKDYTEYQVTSIFIGGGTPSCLKVNQIEEILAQIFQCFFVQPQAEVTIECNPGTLEEEKLHSYYKNGVNRISFGLQSIQEKELRLLGRIHTFDQFLKNYRLARQLGFQNINIDLMSGIPGQQMEDYKETLNCVMELEPEHISAYSLIIEPGTPFYDQYRQADEKRSRGMEQDLLPTEEEERKMYELTKEMLQQKGYYRYEISNYARKGYECKHNNGYWQRKNYLGLGLGAASMVNNVRFSNSSDLKSYLKINFKQGQHPYEERHRLSKKEQIEEFLFLGLRRMEGISGKCFLEQFGITLEERYGEIFQNQIKKGLLEKTNCGYCLTDYGIDVSNRVFGEYL